MKNLSSTLLRYIGRALLRAWVLFEKSMRIAVQASAWIAVRTVYVLLPVVTVIGILSAISHGYLALENRVLTQAHATYQSGVRYVAVNHGYQLPRIEHPSEPFTIDSAIKREFVVNGLPSGLVPVFRALVRHESKDDPNNVSSKGALGLGQVMPEHVKFCGLRTAVELFDPETNIQCAVRVFADSYRQNKSRGLIRVLQGYNASPKGIGIGKENQEYPDKVFAELIKLEME